MYSSLVRSVHATLSAALRYTERSTICSPRHRSRRHWVLHFHDETAKVFVLAVGGAVSLLAVGTAVVAGSRAGGPADRAQLGEILQRVPDGRLRTNIGNVATLDDADAAFNPPSGSGQTIIRVRP
jgi:hypothetical protein